MTTSPTFYVGQRVIVHNSSLFSCDAEAEKTPATVHHIDGASWPWAEVAIHFPDNEVKRRKINTLTGRDYWYVLPSRLKPIPIVPAKNKLGNFPKRRV